MPLATSIDFKPVDLQAEGERQLAEIQIGKLLLVLEEDNRRLPR